MKLKNLKFFLPTLIVVYFFCFVSTGWCGNLTYIKVGSLVGDSVAKIGWSDCTSCTFDQEESPENSENMCFVVKVIKDMDKTSPDLNSFLNTNHIIPQVIIQFFRGIGSPIKNLEITLNNATLYKITTLMDDSSSSEQLEFRLFESAVIEYFKYDGNGQPAGSATRTLSNVADCQRCNSICGPLIIK